MKSQKQTVTRFLPLFFIIILILDAKTSITGAMDGVELCLRTVIPSLFPFFFLSGSVSSMLAGYSGKLLRPIGRICGMPKGAEPLFLLGITGGYPVGAQAIHTAYKAGQLLKSDAQRMLGFCSNAGPAFIFGMAGGLFENAAAPWAIWGIIIISALLTGMILPGKSSQVCSITRNQKRGALEQALHAMAAVCGWVVLFRVLLTILNRWILWLLPNPLAILLAGFLELANGCIELHCAAQPLFRFVALSVILSFGGLCVGLQTKSVIGDLSCKTYFKGKFIQTILSLLLSLLVGIFVFKG